MLTENIRVQNFKTPPPTKEEVVEKNLVFGKYKLKQKKVLYIAGALTLIIICFTIAFNVLLKPPSKPETPLVLTTIPTPTLVPTLPLSPYATDSAILLIEEEIKKTESDLLGTDLKEAGLNPPSLDMDVKF